MAKLDSRYLQCFMVLLHLTVIFSSGSVDNDYASDIPTVPSSNQSTTSPRSSTEKSSTIGQAVPDVTDGVITSQTPKMKETTVQKPTTTTTTTKKQTTSNPGSPISQRGEFLLRDEDGDVCLRAYFVINFKIYYKSKLRDQNEPSIPLSAKASVGGQCSPNEDVAVLTLQWKEDKYTLKFTFKKIETKQKWICERIQFTYDQRNNPDFEDAVNPHVCVVHSEEGKDLFSTKLGNSRSCKREHDITLTSVEKDKVVMEIRKLHLQPFDLKNGTFGEESTCKSDLHNKGNNTASLVVGLLLAIFILIVIAGYAVGRKMGYITERPGYSTME